MCFAWQLLPARRLTSCANSAGTRQTSSLARAPRPALPRPAPPRLHTAARPALPGVGGTAHGHEHMRRVVCSTPSAVSSLVRHVPCRLLHATCRVVCCTPRVRGTVQSTGAAASPPTSARHCRHRVTRRCGSGTSRPARLSRSSPSIIRRHVALRARLSRSRCPARAPVAQEGASCGSCGRVIDRCAPPPQDSTAAPSVRSAVRRTRGPRRTAARWQVIAGKFRQPRPSRR
jgi:hypothetical protein